MASAATGSSAAMLAAVAAGAALGAMLRYAISLWLNPLWAAIPLGTLAANAVGGGLMGLAMGLIQHEPDLSPFMRLLLTTGFLGGLTTFSTFSAETTAMLLREQYGWAAATIALHVGSSLLMTLLGWMAYNAVRAYV